MFPALAKVRDRAQMMARVRAFFAERAVLEVDLPSLTATGSVDVHIDLIPAQVAGAPCYLHSSPEYGMKCLLAEGSGDIYQFAHVFRDGETGERHAPEFMMAEWYRIGFSVQQMIDETSTFVELFVGPKPRLQLTYREAFASFAGIDIDQVSDDLPALLALEVEPQLPPDQLTVITEFPADQAALARTVGDVAERFELFYAGMELANGYHELADPLEQRRRLEEANATRAALNKPTYPIDPRLIQALQRGLPDCCGVAVGFDRLMMARHGLSDIRQVSFGM